MKRLLTLFLSFALVANAAETIRDLTLSGTLNRIRNGAIVTVQTGGEIIIASGGKLTVQEGAIITGISTGTGSYIFTSSDFNVVSDTVSLDYANGQKATSSVPGFMTAADKAKLDAIAAGATVNSTDAQLRDRSTHTGAQAISTITGLQAALDAGATFAALIAVNGSGPNSGTGRVHWSQIEGMPAAFADGTDDGPGGSSSLTFAPPLRKTGDIVSVDAATTSAPGSLSAADKAKLDGIAAGATQNSTDAQLRDRATHTGTQSADTVVDGTTNKAYTAAEKTKLAGVEAGAQVNRAIASQPEAEAGSINDKSMTPLRVAQAIAALTPAGGNVTASSTFGTDEAVLVADGTGRGAKRGHPGFTVNSATGVVAVSTMNATTVNPTAITGATGNFEVFIGNSTSGNFERGNITVGANMTRTKVGGNIVLDSTASGGAGSLPGGAGGLWPTANISSPPTGFFAAGQYGTTAQAALGDWSIIVASLGTVANPTVDVAPGAVVTGTVVNFSSETASLTNFRATTNGTDPTYTVGTAGSSVTVSSNTTYEVIANKQGWVSSAVQSFAYTIDPVPTLTSATLQASGTSIVLSWPETVSYGAGGTGGYALTLSGGAATVTGVSGTGTNSHTLTVSRTVTNSETGTLAYTQPGNGAEDSAGQDVVTFTGLTVNTAAGPGGGGLTFTPVFSDAFSGSTDDTPLGDRSGWDDDVAGLKLKNAGYIYPSLAGGVIERSRVTATHNANHYAEVTIAGVGDGTALGVGLSVRMQVGDTGRYDLFWFGAGFNTLSLASRANGGSGESELQSVSRTYSVGDKIRLYVTGSGAATRLHVQENIAGAGWTDVWVDQNPPHDHDGGAPGVIGYQNSPTIRLDDFVSGNVL
jgi:hypothetical protein